jgi:hypothetical protein
MVLTLECSNENGKESQQLGSQAVDSFQRIIIVSSYCFWELLSILHKILLVPTSKSTVDPGNQFKVTT